MTRSLEKKRYGGEPPHIQKVGPPEEKRKKKRAVRGSDSQKSQQLLTQHQ